MKNVPKPRNMHLNELGLAKTEFCEYRIQLRQPSITWIFFLFLAVCNSGVLIDVTAAIFQGFYRKHSQM